MKNMDGDKIVKNSIIGFGILFVLLAIFTLKDGIRTKLVVDNCTHLKTEVKIKLNHNKTDPYDYIKELEIYKCKDNYDTLITTYRETLRDE